MSQNLLKQVASFDNLYLAFNECSRGKRQTLGYQKSLIFVGEKLSIIEKEVLANNYRWKGYREFFVHDPKKRLVMSAPFMDRVVHHAIHRVIEPIIDPLFSDNVYACRKNKGNKAAAKDLFSSLEIIGSNRFTMKLDVSKYFSSIHHDLLLKKLMNGLPDDSLFHLISSLLKSHPEYEKLKKGIPIGNLTSQLFANFYLAAADWVACQALGVPYYRNESHNVGECFYIRYMDDMVLVAKDKQRILKAMDAIVSYVEYELGLNMEFYKRIPIGRDPIPFLGYVLNHNGYTVLKRNERRFRKKMKRLNKKEAKLSEVAQVRQSFEAWKIL